MSIQSSIHTTENAYASVKALKRLRDSCAELMNQFGSLPLDGSQAECEIESMSLPNQIEAAFSKGGLLVESVADHLDAFIRITQEPAQSIAPWTLVRAALEAGALAVWLLDADITAEQRVQRSLALRFKGLKEQAKYANSVGETKAREKIEIKIARLEEAANQLGFPQIRDKKNHISGIAKHMPNITELIGTNLNQESSYRYLSSMAHGHTWALQQAGFQVVQYKSTRAYEKKLDALSVSSLCAILTICLSRSAWHQFRVFGWDHLKLNDPFHTAYSALGLLSTEIPFWQVWEKPG